MSDIAGGWSPSGSRRNKKLVRERWLDSQQKIYIKGLSKAKFQALQRVIDEGETMPDDLTLSIWERLKTGGRLFMDSLRGEL